MHKYWLKLKFILNSSNNSAGISTLILHKIEPVVIQQSNFMEIEISRNTFYSELLILITKIENRENQSHLSKIRGNSNNFWKVVNKCMMHAAFELVHYRKVIKLLFWKVFHEIASQMSKFQGNRHINRMQLINNL